MKWRYFVNYRTSGRRLSLVFVLGVYPSGQIVSASNTARYRYILAGSGQTLFLRMGNSLHFEHESNRRWLRLVGTVLLVICSSESPAQDYFNPHNLPRGWASPQILKQRLFALAGEGAVNCGHASLSSTDVSDVTSCALLAYSSKKTFYIQYDVQGIDSELAVGFAFNGKDIYAVAWEKLYSWRPQEIVHVEMCPTPTSLYRTGTGKLNCFPPDPNAKRNILSPELDWY